MKSKYLHNNQLTTIIFYKTQTSIHSETFTPFRFPQRLTVVFVTIHLLISLSRSFASQKTKLTCALVAQTIVNVSEQ